MTLDVTVLYFRDCPSWRTMLERVSAAATQVGIPIHLSTLAVETDADADRTGFAGSPTILIGGRDPFARPGLTSALSCRLYPTPDGSAGCPTVDELVEAIRATD